MIEFSHKTKIVATMGPATASAEVLEAMFTAGLDICRINFSGCQFFLNTFHLS